MTQDDRRIILETLANILQDNINQRITLALGNGIVQQLGDLTVNLIQNEPVTINNPSDTIFREHKNDNN